jgi:hypothetical protein
VPNTFKRLTRGIKLLVEHVYTPISQTMTLLTGTGVTTEYLEKEDGTFRVSLNFPYISAFASSSSVSFGRETSATNCFILPALQDEFGKDSEEIQNYELVEVAVSQDTRGEPGAHITGYRGTVASQYEGFINQDEPAAFSLHISASSLETSITNEFEDQVYKLTIPEIALIDTFRTANPFVQTGLNIQMRHNQAYLVEIVPQTTGRAMYSFTVSLKFKTKLRQRDRGATIQNIPTVHNGAFTPTASAPTAPASNSVIQADGATGVNTAFSLVDSFVRNRLKGGYKQDGSLYYNESLLTDAGYDVIAVPLFAPLHVKRDVPSGHGHAADSDDIFNSWETLPYSSAAAFNTFDRALIPIHYPMTIHHVLAAVSYAPSIPGGTSLRPTSTTFTNQVGVGMMTGVRSDLYAIQQVAEASWTPTGGASPIDANRIFASKYWDLISVPLVGAGGTGYLAQGNPVFVGSGTNVTDARTNIAGGASATQGLEQVLDIRWKISDTTLPSAWAADETIIGYPGHWIYIVGKKHLI